MQPQLSNPGIRLLPGTTTQVPWFQRFFFLSISQPYCFQPIKITITVDTSMHKLPSCLFWNVGKSKEYCIVRSLVTKYIVATLSN